jgi:hypothetical protein
VFIPTLALVMVLWASPATLGEGPSSPKAPLPTDRMEPEAAQPPPRRHDRAPRKVSIPGPRPDSTRGTPGTPLKGLRALNLGEGEGQVVFGAVQQTIRPGQSLGGYRVEAVGPGRVVLSMSGGGLGDSVALVTFDALGRPRVRVYSTVDTTGAKPPEVP